MAGHNNETTVTLPLDAGETHVYRAVCDPASGEITDHGFTGHKHNDSIGLVYAQARFYLPGVGRFLLADTIVPEPGEPQSLNRYSYVRNTPLIRFDPSGRCDEDHSQLQDCLAVKSSLEDLYGVKITGDWWFDEVEAVQEAFLLVIQSFISDGLAQDDALQAFSDIVSGLKLNRDREHRSYRAIGRITRRIDFYDGTFRDTRENADGTITHSKRTGSAVYGTIVHEIAHKWDDSMGRALSKGLMEAVDGSYEHNILFFHFGEYTVGDLSPYRAGSPHPPNHREDWAYTFQAYVVDKNSLIALNPADDDRRVSYMSGVIQSLGD